MHIDDLNVANETQRAMDRMLGAGAGHRVDYSNHALSRKAPTTVQEFDALAMEANTAGPGSAAFADYYTLLQMGMDRDHLPDASGGGIPRSIHDTAEALRETADIQRQYFQPNRIHPLLTQQGWQGRSFADWGPEATREIVSQQMATARPNERAAWVAVSAALDNSPATTMGISFEGPTEPYLEWHAPMGDDNAGDPSGYSQRMAGGDQRTPMETLLIRNQNNSSELAGVDMATVGSGGGTWYADLAIAQEGGRDFHQGDVAFAPANQ